MSKEYQVKTNRPLGFRFLGGIVRIFKRKPRLVNLSGGELSQKAIYLMNHCGASGPLTFELYFPVTATPWGANEMCGSYRERWKYLYHVFYRQKLHWGRFRSFFVATLFAVISKYLYNSVGLIGTYSDGRLISTIRNSMTVLDSNVSVVIFPEDSSTGYLERPKAFYNGFVALADIYCKKTGIDVPVYNVCYSRRKRKFFVDRPMFVGEMMRQGKKPDEIANEFLQNFQRLYDERVPSKKKFSARKKNGTDT